MSTEPTPNPFTIAQPTSDDDRRVAAFLTELRQQVDDAIAQEKPLADLLVMSQEPLARALVLAVGNLQSAEQRLKDALARLEAASAAGAPEWQASAEPFLSAAEAAAYFPSRGPARGPARACPACSGHGCPRCHGKGMIPA